MAAAVPLQYGLENLDFIFVANANNMGDDRRTPHQLNDVLNQKIEALRNGLDDTEFVMEGIERVKQALSFKSTAASEGTLLDKRYTIVRRVLERLVSLMLGEYYKATEIREILEEKMLEASPSKVGQFKTADLKEALKELGLTEDQIKGLKPSQQGNIQRVIAKLYVQLEDRAITELKNQNLLPQDLRADDLRHSNAQKHRNDPYRYPNNVDKITRNVLTLFPRGSIDAELHARLGNVVDLAFGTALWRYYRNLSDKVDSDRERNIWKEHFHVVVSLAVLTGVVDAMHKQSSGQYRLQLEAEQVKCPYCERFYAGQAGLAIHDAKAPPEKCGLFICLLFRDNE